jgi:rare lipoprotein A
MTGHPAIAGVAIVLALLLGALATYIATRGEFMKLSPAPVLRWRAQHRANQRHQLFKELAIAFALSGAVVLVMMFGANAAGWDWFLKNIRPTGQCGFGQQEIIGSIYWHGKRTANGERFKPDGISAAHRSLPFGTIVTVRNQRNGRTASVRINDRGPYIKGVRPNGAIDLSRGAARALGMTFSEYVCVNW